MPAFSNREISGAVEIAHAAATILESMRGVDFNGDRAMAEAVEVAAEGYAKRHGWTDAAAGAIKAFVIGAITESLQPKRP